MRRPSARQTTSPFGADDEIGMLNLIDARSRDAIVSRADASKIFDLSVDYFVGMPSWDKAGDPQYQVWMTHTPTGEQITDHMKLGRRRTANDAMRCIASLLALASRK